MKAQDIMTKDVITVRENMLLSRLCEKFSKSNYSGFPVVDKDNRIVGMVAERDVCQYLNNAAPLDPTTTGNVGESLINFAPPAIFGTLFSEASDMTVSAVMTKNVAVATENTPVQALAKKMSEKDVNRIPVVDEDNKIVGIVGRADIIRSLAK